MKLPRDRKKDRQASAQNTTTHKHAITTKAPPQRVSADSRNSENLGAAALLSSLSRANLIAVPCGGKNDDEGYNVVSLQWQDAAETGRPKLGFRKLRQNFAFQYWRWPLILINFWA